MPYKDKARRYDAIRNSVAKNPEHYRMLNKNNQNKPIRLDYMLRRRYGISLAQFEEMLEKQGGVCKICRNPPSMKGREKRLHVDHCHRTNRVRGLLCHRCNVFLGFLEQYDLTTKAKAYLENNP